MPSTVVILAPSTDPTGHKQELMVVKWSFPAQTQKSQPNVKKDVQHCQVTASACNSLANAGQSESSADENCACVGVVMRYLDGAGTTSTLPAS